MNIVIGSGHAGVAAARALAASGSEVTVLDPGGGLEDANEALRHALAERRPDEWSAEQLTAYRAAMQPTTSGVPVKLVYGSDFVLRDSPVAAKLELDNAKVSRSHATGGLSNIWGACVLPYAAEEIDDWPISSQDLAPHYAAVLRFVPHTGCEDYLSARFPVLRDGAQALQPSAQAEAFLNDLARRKERLERCGIRFGRARLSVRAAPSMSDPIGCRYCGLCLYGCPYRLIYSATDTLRSMVRAGQVKHVAGVVVDRIVERNARVEILARRAQDGERLSFSARKVFLAAGFVESARIMLESLGQYDVPLRVRHSDRFVLPLVRYRREKGAADASLHTLCQAFLEIADDRICRRAVHLQAYTYNDLYARALERRLGRMAPYVRLPIQQLSERLLVLFGYLHSDVSSHLSLSVAKSGAIRITGHVNPRASRVARRVAFRLLSLAASLRAVPMVPRLDPPGGGNHTGGSFPMSRSPTNLQSDIWGRVGGLTRVHLVDSSVLPSLPGSTISLTIMANAHRIASECPS